MDDFYIDIKKYIENDIYNEKYLEDYIKQKENDIDNRYFSYKTNNNNYSEITDFNQFYANSNFANKI